jgi:protocatechuate 3,4-dioxygenase alpha subunit
MIMEPISTPSQTIGPFFHFCLATNAGLGCVAGPGAKGERIRLVCRILDGDGAPVNDAMLEVWQADAAGDYNRSDDSTFRGFGRLCTNEDGVSVFETIKPGRVAEQAPHVNVLIFARGLLKQLCTRIYFADEPSNLSDPVLTLVPEDRRGTLLAHRPSGNSNVWNFEIRLAADCETVFFDI